MFKYLIPFCFMFTTACGDCECNHAPKKVTKMSPNEHDHYKQPVPTFTAKPVQMPVQKPVQYPTAKPVKQSPVQSPVQQAPTQAPYPDQTTRYACRCSGVETVCTADQLKDPRLGCYIVW